MQFICPSDICTPMFIAALVTIAKKWKTLTSSVDEWIKQLWYTHTTEDCSFIKNEILSFSASQMELIITMSNETSKSQ
jgi:hypothetical protein